MKPRYVLAFALCVLVTACSSLGIAPAKSLSDRLAYGYGVMTAIRQTATQELTAGTLSASDAEQALKLTDQARTLLDASKSLLDSDPKGADSKLLLATAILTNLQAYLRSKQT
ncbi:MAG TPA: hypothetical protein VFA81_05740 [Burkholderiales bacterium]|nr:hypothetical protein [Burkholderiales bacterium]